MEQERATEFVMKALCWVVAIFLGWLIFNAFTGGPTDYPATNYPKADKWFDSQYPEVKDIYCQAADDWAHAPELYESWDTFRTEVTNRVGYQHTQRFVNQKCGLDLYEYPISGKGKMWTNF